MAAAFTSVSKNQTLRLALKSLLLSLAIFWWRGTGSISLALFLVVIFAYSYFRPLAQSSRFLIAFLAIIALPFVFPPLGSWEFCFAISIGALAFAVISVKDLLFVNRRFIVQLLYFIILGTIICLYLFRPGVVNQVIVFISLSLLFRELYSFLLEEDSMTILLLSSAYSFLAIELGWAVSLLPLSRISASTLITAILLIAHNLTLNYKSNSLSRHILLRDFVLFFILVIAILSISSWSLA